VGQLWFRRGTFIESGRLHIYLLQFRRIMEGHPMYYDLIGIITLLLTIWALIGILTSGVQPLEKLIWVLVVIIMPIVGFVLWYLIGPGKKSIPGRRSL
jgi:hypothetical protein